jgi:hypothetical protein
MTASTKHGINNIKFDEIKIELGYNVTKGTEYFVSL